MLFVVATLVAGAVVNPVEHAFFPGRSGDIVLTGAERVADAAHLVLVGAGEAAGPSAMSETSIAPLVAHVAGALATAFPAPMPEVKPALLAPAEAVLLLTVEGLTLAEVEAAAYPKLAALVAQSHAVELEPSFMPRDRVSVAVSRVTGTTPADHGIATKAWLDAKTGEVVRAFAAGRDEAAARVAGLADVIGQSSQGRALLLSLSSDTQVAAAAGAHPSLARGSAASWPAAVLSYDSESRTTKPAQIGGALAAPTFTVSFDDALAALRRVAPDQLAALDTTSPAEAALVAELGAPLVVLGRVAADAALAALLADGVADLVAIDLAAPAALKENAAAMRLVDAVVPEIIAQFTAAWGQRARAGLVLTPPERLPAVSAPPSLAGWTVLGAHVFRAASPSREDDVTACERFGEAVEGSAVTAHCFVQRHARRLQEANATLPLGEAQYTSDQLELFQVTLWSSILLGVALLVGSCALYNMEVTQDSLLFSKAKGE